MSSMRLGSSAPMGPPGPPGEARGYAPMSMMGPPPPGPGGPPFPPMEAGMMQTGAEMLSQQRAARGPLSPNGTRVQQQPNMCCESTPNQRAPDWSFVGEGMGAYEKVETFNYVGQGMGSFQNTREVAPFRNSSGPRTLCVGLLVAAAVISLVYLIFSELGRHGRAIGTTPSRYRFDCEAGQWNANRGWSEEKKAYCCQTSGTGCARPTPTTQPGNPHNFVCNAGTKNWKKGWSDAKKTYCCRTAHIGCDRPTTTTHAQPATGCDTKCRVDGKDWSCKDRMQWAASHEYQGQTNACNVAYNHVIGQCPACNRCPISTLLSSSTCQKAPAPAPSPVAPAGGCSAQCQLNGQSHSCASRIKFLADSKYGTATNKCTKAYREVLTECDMCTGCPLSDTGCQVTAATNPGPPPLAATSQPFDCNAGFDNWIAGWSMRKMKWCCKYHNKGCQ